MFENVTERIIEMLRMRNMKQIDLARACGLSANAMTNYIKKKRIPDTQALFLIARELHTTMEWLLTGQGHMTLDSEITEAPKNDDVWALSEFQREEAASLFPLLTEEQVALIDNYAKLNRRDQAEIRLLIQHKIAEYQNQEHEAPIQKGLSSHSPPLRGKQGGSQTA